MSSKSASSNDEHGIEVVAVNTHRPSTLNMRWVNRIDSGAAAGSRELSADLYRASALVLIVIGHRLAASVTFRGGRFDNDTVLAVVPWTQWLTWAFRVVPLFFLVAGYANAVSWTRWRVTDSEGLDPRRPRPKWRLRGRARKRWCQ